MTQDEVLQAITDYTAKNGYPPSVRELGDMLEIRSTSHVVYWLERLAKAGRIRRGRGRARAIAVVQDGRA